ncbi:hypothetical protein RCL1_003160 [Eukaryota sp. TZLM3-RCL]
MKLLTLTHIYRWPTYLKLVFSFAALFSLLLFIVSASQLKLPAPEIQQCPLLECVCPTCSIGDFPDSSVPVPTHNSESSPLCPSADVYDSLDISTNEPIDILISWVDDSDPVWAAKRNAEYRKLGMKPLDNDRRWKEHSELKYCIRSIEKFYPNFRYLYLLTDNQIPSFISLNHPKLKIISHHDIVPKELHNSVLPTFNSVAFEVFLWNIPNISTNFLYLNDDFFFGNSVDISYFLDSNRIVQYHHNDVWKPANTEYSKAIFYTIKQLKNKLNTDPKKGYQRLAHFPRLINKKLFKHIFDLFYNEMINAANSKFRYKKSEFDTMSAYLFGINSLSNLNCKSLVSMRLQYTPYIAIANDLQKTKNHLKMIKYIKPPFYNINDNLRKGDPHIIQEVLHNLAEFFENMYPTPSSFEKFSQ